MEHAIGACERTSTIICTQNPDCPITGRCSATTAIICTSSPDCPVPEECIGISQEKCKKDAVQVGACDRLLTLEGLEDELRSALQGVPEDTPVLVPFGGWQRTRARLSAPS